jgi:hypothetical protein
VVNIQILKIIILIIGMKSRKGLVWLKPEFNTEIQVSWDAYLEGIGDPEILVPVILLAQSGGFSYFAGYSGSKTKSGTRENSGSRSRSWSWPGSRSWSRSSVGLFSIDEIVSVQPLTTPVDEFFIWERGD